MMLRKIKSEKLIKNELNATKTITSTLGVFGGIAGGIHGFFEAIQGNQPTNGLVIYAVGKGNSWTRWVNGTEGAFTSIPNFLVTGIVAIIVGLVMAIWSARYIDTKNGSSVFLLIGACLFLVGGGVAQAPFIFLTWFIARRINKPLRVSKAISTSTSLKTTAKLWLSLLMVFVLMFALAFEISPFGFLPAINNLNQLNIICWTLLSVASGILLASIGLGFNYDAEKQTILQQKINKEEKL